MTQTELLVLNFEEVRRRSIKLWSGIPQEFFLWKPDSKALSCIEMIRHVLEGEYIYHKVIDSRGDCEYTSPWVGRNYGNLQDELEFAKPYREEFLEKIASFTPEDLSMIEIVRASKGQRRKLGDYLQRIAYHESVHAGQMLSYLRTLGIERPAIWD